MASDRSALTIQRGSPRPHRRTRRFGPAPLPRLTAPSLLAALAFGAARDQAPLTRAQLPAVKPDDQWKFELRDKRTCDNVRDTASAVTAVSATQIDSIENGAAKVATRDLVVLKNSDLDHGLLLIELPTGSGQSVRLQDPVEAIGRCRRGQHVNGRGGQRVREGHDEGRRVRRHPAGSQWVYERGLW